MLQKNHLRLCNNYKGNDFNNGESSHLPLNQLKCSITKAETTHIITTLLMRCSKPKVEPEFKLLGPYCQFTGNTGEAEEQDK